MPTAGNSKSLGSLLHNDVGLAAALLRSGSAIVGTAPKYVDSTAIIILSDSTGIQPSSTTAWPYLLAQAYAAAFPSAAVVVRVWNDATQDYDAATNITANTERYVRIAANDGTARTRSTEQAAVSAFSNLDLRVDVAPDDWTPASTAGLVGRWGGAGAKSHRLKLRTDGKLELEVTTDGSTSITATSTVATGFTDGVRKKVRVTRLDSSGAVNFYTADPGTTAWTQLGTQVSATSGALATVTRDYELGGTGSQFMVPGNYFGVQYRADIDNGKIVNPQPIESWWNSENVSPMQGAPTIYFYVGAKGGADAAYLTDATRGPKLVPPHYIPAIGLVNNGHNESTSITIASFFTAMDGFKTLLNSRCNGATMAVMTQNPRTDGVEESHRRHMNWLRGWALRNAAPLIDVYGAFLADTTAIADNLQGDGLHPDASGAVLWANTVANRMIL